MEGHMVKNEKPYTSEFDHILVDLNTAQLQSQNEREAELVHKLEEAERKIHELDQHGKDMSWRRVAFAKRLDLYSLLDDNLQKFPLKGHPYIIGEFHEHTLLCARKDIRVFPRDLHHFMNHPESILELTHALQEFKKILDEFLPDL
ncbi:hypothetical protein R1flu_013411 [Riccia fluitans]|uniref:Uncharacterized protein n=1 Tax=Riccia fluitans TaxID=41844 RepID=A0ABD1YDI5_9MARC